MLRWRDWAFPWPALLRLDREVRKLSRDLASERSARAACEVSLERFLAEAEGITKRRGGKK